ncbi:hypothetical protein E2C01_058194 [Portunus trituberculatus]|uniref:Uncharacterized protein n=1 Tax=Portunus trituberculatus TaxID=210409 RepID=A0A5B7H5F0_PORTR|nr:hypothetical protein [Portunus trituberculatus]
MAVRMRWVVPRKRHWSRAIMPGARVVLSTLKQKIVGLLGHRGDRVTLGPLLAESTEMAAQGEEGCGNAILWVGVQSKAPLVISNQTFTQGPRRGTRLPALVHLPLVLPPPPPDQSRE